MISAQNHRVRLSGNRCSASSQLAIRKLKVCVTSSISRRNEVSTGSDSDRMALWQPPCKVYYSIAVTKTLEDAVAAPRLRTIVINASRDSQRLALGLALAAAS